MATKYYLKPQSLVRQENETDFNVRKLCDDILCVGAGGSSAVPNYTIGDPNLYKVNHIVKLNSDGTVDTSFNAGTTIHSNSRCILQNDGKILVFNEFYSNGIIRLNNDGSVDNTFNTGSGFDSYTVTAAIQSDGKILVGGDFSTFDGNAHNRLVRLNTNGSIDNTFSVGSGFNGTVKAIAIQSDEKILIGGTFTSYQGTPFNNLIRLTSSGTIDDSFQITTGISNDPFAGDTPTVEHIAIYDNKIIVGGRFQRYNGTISNNLTRINFDGTIDDTLYINPGFNSFVYDTKLQNNKLICVGGFTTYNGETHNRLIRLNNDGSVDNTFSTGTALSQIAYSINLLNEDIIIGGAFSTYNGQNNGGIVLINTNGSINNNFNSGLGFHISNTTGTILSILNANNKLILSGNFIAYDGSILNNGFNKPLINRKTQTLDNIIFGSGFNNAVRAIAFQSDNKILVGGSFTNYNGTSVTRIVRLNTDGSVDPTFVTGSGFNNRVMDIVVKNDGKILIGGYFTSYNGVSANRIIQLTASGTIDGSFNIGTGVTNASYVGTIKIQDDNKILIGGVFNTYKGTTSNNIARINTNGNIDSLFLATNVFFGGVSDIGLMSDNKIVVAGRYGFGGPLAILNNDGSLYEEPYPLETSTINTIAILDDDSIIIGYSFNADDMVNKKHKNLKKLQSNGIIDSTFYRGLMNADSRVNKILIQSDNKILIFGVFSGYDTVPCVNLIRLYSDGTLDQTMDFGIKQDLYTIALLK